jgi:hypothetical protein
MASVIELKKNLNQLIESGFNSLVSYKTSSKSFNDMKKLMEKDLDVTQIVKKIEFYKEQQKKLEKVNLPANQKVSLYNKYRGEQKKYADLLKHAQQNNSNKWLVEVEKKFLKEKEIFRNTKIIILSAIEKIITQLKINMGEDKFKEYKNKLYLKTFTDDTNMYTYSVKKIMNYLKSGPISEESSKKSKQINELSTRKNVKNRKNKMEHEILMIKMQKILKKLSNLHIQFIKKIKKIIEREDDTNLRRKLFHIIRREKRNENFQVITNASGNPVMEEIEEINVPEFDKFISSKFQLTIPQTEIYQPEIDKYRLKRVKLLDKITSLEKNMAKLKGISWK